MYEINAVKNREIMPFLSLRSHVQACMREAQYSTKCILFVRASRNTPVGRQVDTQAEISAV